MKYLISLLAIPVQLKECLSQQTERLKDVQTDGEIDGQTDRRTVGHLGTLTYGQQMKKRTERHMNG